MSQVDKELLGEILAEAGRLEPDHDRHLAAIRVTGVPMNAKDKGDDEDVKDKDVKDGDKPPWGSDAEFSPQRAWDLIQNLRGENRELKTERDDLKTKNKEFEDASKSDQEKLNDRASGAEKDATTAKSEAARLRVALRKGLTEVQAKRLVGDTEADLEKDADELLSDFKQDDDKGGGGGDDQESTRRTPHERLRPGAAPGSEPDKDDPASLAAEVPRGY
jgi:hypothetical protein